MNLTNSLPPRVEQFEDNLAYDKHHRNTKAHGHRQPDTSHKPITQNQFAFDKEVKSP